MPRVKISVVMPLYNAEAHLAEAIQSYLDQTLKETELLCVDDGSGDSSPQILSDFQRQDERISVFTQANKGAGHARNLALENAAGDYIAFLDSDDYYPDESTLETLYELASHTGASVAGGSLLFLDKAGTRAATEGQINYGFSREEVITYRDLQQAYYYQRFVYSREMLETAGIAFPPYRRFQDVVFFVQAMLAAKHIAVTDRPVYVYRKNQKYAELSDEQINDMLQGYLDVLALAEEHNLDELFAFLGARMSGGSHVLSLVKDSISRGNAIAGERYDEIRNLLAQHGLGYAKRGSLVSVRNALRALKRRLAH